MNTCPECDHSPLPAAATSCPRCHAPLVAAPGGAAPVNGTRLESVDDLRRWMTPPHSSDTPNRQAAATAPRGVAAAAADDDDAKRFRPTARPPILVVCIVDEGKNGGEWRRVRGERAVIGRAEGDLLVPHDAGISGRHAELVRLESGGRYRWWLRDLQSTNGTFARVTSAFLEDQQEFLIGATRFRFEAAAGAPPPPDGATSARNATRGWQVVTPADAARLAGSLVELAADAPEKRTPLADDELWIGADPACHIVLGGDPFVSRRHAKVARGPQGRWQIENDKTRNGTWLRIREVPIDASAEIQAGEQRFLIKVC